MSDLEISVPKIESLGPSPNAMMPFDDDRQIVNFWAVLSAVEICDGSEIRVLPRPNIPLVPPTRACNKNVGPQEKRKSLTVVIEPAALD